MKKDTIRLAALRLAIGDFMSEAIDEIVWEEMDEEELIEHMDGFSVWQPFENWPYRDVIDEIEKSAHNIEATIRHCIEEGLE